jgi:hypothetical protein
MLDLWDIYLAVILISISAIAVYLVVSHLRGITRSSQKARKPVQCTEITAVRKRKNSLNRTTL